MLALTETAAALPDGGALLLVEQVEGDVEAALNQLRLASAFGSGVRSEGAFAELVARAGLSVRELTDIGWDHRLWVLARQG